MADALRVLMVEDEPEHAELAIEALGTSLPCGVDIAVTTRPSFQDAFEEIVDSRPDILLLDVKDQGSGTNPGPEILDLLRGRLFAPVVFYTANAGSVEALQSSFVSVVSKGLGVDALVEAVDHIAAGRLPGARRTLSRFADTALANFMWSFAESHWDDLGEIDEAFLEALMARALAHGMSRSVPGAGGGTIADPTEAQPLLYYHFLPSPDGKHYSGELVVNPDTGEIRVLVSPTCRIHQAAPPMLVMAGCIELAEHQLYTDAAASNAAQNRLRSALRQQVSELHFLPGAAKVPSLFVDFTDLAVASIAEVDNMQFLAQIASPYLESMVGRFASYFGALGCPDLNVADWIPPLVEQADH